LNTDSGENKCSYRGKPIEEHQCDAVGPLRAPEGGIVKNNVKKKVKSIFINQMVGSVNWLCTSGTVIYYLNYKSQ